MTAFTSSGSGVWHNAAQWGGADYPGSTAARSDTATIASGHIINLGSVSDTGIISTITINKSGTLTIGCVRDQVISSTLYVLSGALLDFNTSANTELLMKGNLSCYGTMNMGTVATPISSANTCILTFDCASDGQYGLTISGLNASFVAQGAVKTISALLGNNTAVNDLSCYTTAATGWLDNDDIAFSPTSRTYTEKERGQVNGNVSAQTILFDGFGGVGGGHAYSHLGTSPYNAEVINLTRNCKIQSRSATNVTYILFACDTTTTIDCDYVEFKYIGANTTNKQGVVIRGFVANSPSSANFEGCSINVCEAAGFEVLGTNTNNITINRCVGYSVGALSYAFFYHNIASSGTNVSVTNNVFIGNSYGIRLADVGCTVSSNIMSGGSSGGMLVSEPYLSVVGNLNNNIIHATNGTGINLSYLTTVGSTGPITSCCVYRNGGAGFMLGNGTVSCELSAWTLSANTSYNFSSGNATDIGSVKMYNCYFGGDATYATNYGTNFALLAGSSIISFKDCEFGWNTTHSSADLMISFGSICQVDLDNCILNSTELGDSATIPFGGYIKSSDHNQNVGTFKTWVRYGLLQTDTVIYRTDSPSLRMTPNNASNKLLNKWKVPVASGSPISINAYLRKSASTDAGGAYYNGNQPTINMMGRGISLQSSPMTVSVSSWESVSVSGTPTSNGVVDVWVDCDGTAGWVNVDDFGVS
jgi:hypothetical protein